MMPKGGSGGAAGGGQVDVLVGQHTWACTAPCGLALLATTCVPHLPSLLLHCAPMEAMALNATVEPSMVRPSRPAATTMTGGGGGQRRCVWEQACSCQEQGSRLQRASCCCSRRRSLTDDGVDRRAGEAVDTLEPGHGGHVAGKGVCNQCGIFFMLILFLSGEHATRRMQLAQAGWRQCSAGSLTEHARVGGHTESATEVGGHKPGTSKRKKRRAGIRGNLRCQISVGGSCTCLSVWLGA